MSQSDIEILQTAIQRNWSQPPGDKAKAYIGTFFNCQRIGSKIMAQVEGNHGTYTVSIQAKEQEVTSACSCYIGQDGFCHHCAALAVTFLKNPTLFTEIKAKPLAEIADPADLHTYLKSVTLESLLQQLKAGGMTQKAFAESIGMSTQHLAAVKSSELKNRYFHELGATKLACLWFMEHFLKPKTGD